MTKENKNIIPRGNQILVKIDDAESRINEYGIVLPDEVEQERKSQGIVQAVGSDIKDIKNGDRVIYGAYSGEKLKIRENNKVIDYVVCEDKDVIAFIR